MTFFSDMFTQSSDNLWFILAAVLMLLELAIPGLFLVWLALAAALMGLVMLLIPFDISWQAQLLIFAAVSVLAVYFGKNFVGYGKLSDKHENGLNKRGHRLIGHIVTVDSLTNNDKGKAKIGDSVWTIEGNDLVVGSQMQVVDIEGNVLIVEAVEA